VQDVPTHIASEGSEGTEQSATQSGGVEDHVMDSELQDAVQEVVADELEYPVPHSALHEAPSAAELPDAQEDPAAQLAPVGKVGSEQLPSDTTHCPVATFNVYPLEQVVHWLLAVRDAWSGQTSQVVSSHV
jgi:hypothetical protein